MPKYDDKNKSKGESKPNYYDGNDSRQANESKEGLDVVDNSTAPETRFATKQQVGQVAKAAEAETPKTGFTKKKTDAGGSAVKQEVASRVLLADSDYAGIPGAASSSAGKSGLRTLSYSGDAGTILGTAANTPVVGTPSRSEGRFEKKLDAASKKIDFLASEQVITEYKNPSPLGASSDSPQGYYGTPKNTSVRSQKSAGGTPASLLVERSADEITRDELIFITGQYVKSDLGVGNTYGVEPTQSSEFTDAGVRQAKDLEGDDAIVYGNWLNRNMQVTFKKDGTGAPYVSAVSFTSVNCSDDEAAQSVNAASTNWLIDMNQDEISRQNIDSKAGRETELNWSPLGRAVLQPTATVGLLRRLEEDLGANVYTSYRLASKAHSYQLNKAAKDGQRVHTPMLEMFIGDIGSYMSSKDFSDGDYYNGFKSIFDPKLYAAGSASLVIALFDSVGKYNTKADVLLMPRSLRKAFQVADNNMDVFRLKQEFAAAINNRDVFSTIDRNYDPLLPVCMTDRIGLISPISYDRFGSFTRDSVTSKRTYTYSQFKYAYSNRSSNYEITVGHPLLDGIADFLEQHASKIYSLLKGDSSDGSFTLNVPIKSSTKTFSLWDFLVLHSVPFMQKARINSMRDVLDFEVNFEYPFEFKTIKDLNPTNSVNYKFTDIDTPLQSRIMIPSVAITWTMPEFFWNVGTAGDSKWLTVMPWYFNEMQFIPNAVTDEDDGAPGFEQDFMSGVMSMPVIRNGVRLSYLDDLYGMSERDVRLCLDRMVRMPLGVTSTDQYNVYKYGQANEGIPVSAGRFTLQQFISVPRELGWFMTAPHALLRTDDTLAANAKLVGFTTFAKMTDYCNGNTSYRLYCYKGVTDVENRILTASDVNISRAQAFKQYWDCSPAACMAAIGGADSNGYRPRLNVGFLVSLKQCFSNSAVANVKIAENQGFFRPFTMAYSENSASIQQQSADKELNVIALHKGLWGRLQRLPMVISPWDTCDFLGGTGANYDPYDFAYMFGFAGMMASDYNQDLYNRTNMVQEAG